MNAGYVLISVVILPCLCFVHVKVFLSRDECSGCSNQAVQLLLC